MSEGRDLFFLYFWIEERIEYYLKTMFILINYETVEVSNNRGMHYMELLREAMVCKTYDDLCSWVERKAKSLNSFSLDKVVHDLMLGLFLQFSI